MRHFRRRVGALSEEDRKALAAAAHLKEPGTAQDLNAIGVSRNARLTLMAQGLLEQTPSQDDRRYYVHPLVAEHLTFQEAADFETMERLANTLLEEVRGKRGPTWIAAAQESNRLLVEARKQRARTPLPFPDSDPYVESIRGLMRRKHARLDIARTRVNEVLKIDPQNTELLLADAELKADGEAVERGRARRVRARRGDGADARGLPSGSEHVPRQELAAEGDRRHSSAACRRSLPTRGCSGGWRTSTSATTASTTRSRRSAPRWSSSR